MVNGPFKRPSKQNLPSNQKKHSISTTTTNLDKSRPNCDTFTETPALKDNSSSKLNSNISKNVPKS